MKQFINIILCLSSQLIFAQQMDIPSQYAKLFINEVAPQGTITTPSDWIELYNDNQQPVSLNDVYITNKKSTPFKWQLKNLTIPAKGFLILYADKDTVLGNNHLNFKLGSSTEKLYLFYKYSNQTVKLTSFELPNISSSDVNMSFGAFNESECMSDSRDLTKFLGGSPNAANATGRQLVKLKNNLPRGIVARPTRVTLTAPQGLTIRYTTDNSMPTRTYGKIYTQPILIIKTTVLKAFAYSDNAESKVAVFSYIFPVKGAELKFPELVTPTEFEKGLKQLPIISLSSSDSVDSRTEKLTSFEYIHKFGKKQSVAVFCGVNGYGNESYNSDQKNMSLHFRKKYGFSELEHAIFEKEEGDTYEPTTQFNVLDLKIGQDGPSADGFGMTMTSQGLISKSMRELGNIDLHTQYVHVYVNAKYHGIYTLKEHWDEHFGETYYGGSKDDYDEIDETNGWINGAVHLNGQGKAQGTIRNWNMMKQAAENTDFQTVKKYLNVNQYIDLMLHVMMFDAQWEFRAIADRDLKATKFVFENHDTDGSLMKTIEDYLTMHDNKWLETIDFEEILNGPGGIFGNLYRSQNKEFKTLIRDRIYEAMQKENGALTVKGITRKLSDLKSVIRPVFNMELARFNATFYNNNPYFDQEFDAHLAYLPTRFDFTLAKWLERGLVHTLSPVTFNQPSGTNVKADVLVTNPNAVGVIYYTIDGSDPLDADGAIRPTAILYNRKLALNMGTNKVVARPYYNGEFGPKTMATYKVELRHFAMQTAQILTANGKLNAQKGVLTWISKTSDGSDYFKIEKLDTKDSFQTVQIMNVRYSSNRDAIELYDWTDNNMVEGDNFYRIALFSSTSKTPQYSNIVHLKFTPAEVYAIFPNPTSEFFDIDLKSVEGKMVDIMVFNSIGTPILTKRIEKATLTERVNIEKLETGQYQVVIQPQGKRVTMRKIYVIR